MYGEEKSDSLIVAANLANNPQGAESVERRSGAKGNAEQPHMRRTQSRESMSQRLSRVREAAKQRKKERFTALFHLLTAEALENAFLSLSRKAAAGVDGVRWKDYAENLKVNIADLHRRLHQGSYRAQPGRRHYIPKADGKQRPLGIASLEDKIVQYALVKILNAVYENDFMGFSYGFRPGRSQHNALDALATGLVRTNVNWVLDADISQFFDKVSHEWLIRFIEHRIGDQRVIRLIRKWLTAGTSEEGEWRASEEGTPQGAVISPLLANIYLHYVFDLWAHQWRRRHATGNVVMVRYADDIVIGFDKRIDAQCFRIPHVALPAFDRNGKSAGIWLSPLTDKDGRLQAIGGEGRVMGNEEARFVALQGSRNGESLLAGNMGEGVRIARDNPDSGVVVRLAGDDRPWNPGAITGGRVWGDIDAVVTGGSGANIPLPPDLLAQKTAEELQRKQIEKQAQETARELTGEKRKQDEVGEQIKDIITDVVRGLERQKGQHERFQLPDEPENRLRNEAVQKVVADNQQQDRLQQIERDMVRDLTREKTLGGD